MFFCVIDLGIILVIEIDEKVERVLEITLED